jgi:ubiquinone/menaquinone biosynthesis C-methylase UbiE
MTWHETIEYIRKNPEYADLVCQAYFDEDIVLNVERFGQSDEFNETLRLIRQFDPSAKTILEIGAGNGIAAVNFALLKFLVTAVEPDASDTVGAGAINKLIRYYQLNNINVIQGFAEEIGFPDGSFDVVYIRQAMHHAYDLKKFIGESARVVKTGGIVFTVRDHVIFDKADKEWFLEMHPLHKYYGGENAFTADEYKAAMMEAGLEIVREFKYYDNVINYFPVREEELERLILTKKKHLKAQLRTKISLLAEIPPVFSLYKMKNGYNSRLKFLNEREIPGRLYSYIARKK